MNLSNLSGPDLDFFVAKALERDAVVTGQDKYGAPILGGARSLSFLIQKYRDFPQAWSPSTKWEDAGPLIERFGLTVCHGDLRFAMESFVISRLGDSFAEISDMNKEKRK